MKRFQNILRHQQVSPVLHTPNPPQDFKGGGIRKRMAAVATRFTPLGGITSTKDPAGLDVLSPSHEPYKAKTIQHINFSTIDERRQYLEEANFNVTNLCPSQVSFDMISYGTAAMSQEQRSVELLGDEAYAGARSFKKLESATQKVTGHTHCCPVHNALGAVKLLLTTMMPLSTDFESLTTTCIPTNDCTPWKHVLGESKDVQIIDIRCAENSEDTFRGNVDLSQLEQVLTDVSNQVAFVSIRTYANHLHPISLHNLRSTFALAEKYGKCLVLDASHIVDNAWFIRENERSATVAEIVRDLSLAAHVVQLDGAIDARCPTGGVLAITDCAAYARMMNEVVVYEGLHTYGGMSGRTMESFARGLEEMCNDDDAHWAAYQTSRFNRRLLGAGLPMGSGCDGAYICAKEFLANHSINHQDAFSAALYERTGVRAVALGGRRMHGEGRKECFVPVQIPRFSFSNDQLDEVANAIINLYQDRDSIPPLEVTSGCEWQDQMAYQWAFPPEPKPWNFKVKPYTTHTFERISHLSRKERRHAIEDAGYNTFLLKSEDVVIDLLTDSGTSAMSSEQWASYSQARSTPATSEEYKKLVATLQEITGYKYIIPVHQGRAGEHILSEIMIRDDQLVPGNMYFTTTKLHQELAGGVFADVIVDDAYDPESCCLWKGNIDLSKLKSLVDQCGAESIAYISFEHSVNMAGGQPVSMDNMREVYAYCSSHNIPVFFDATRVAENAVMIQQRDPKYASTSVVEILHEMFSYGDGCTVSGKKDCLINIGGLLAFRSNLKWKEAAEEKLRVYEGGVVNGGLSSSDLAAMHIGAREMVADDYIRTRIEQTAKLGQLLLDSGIPIVTPPGSHAIFLDARRFLPHIDQDDFPAQRLAAELYVETGVRAMERGNVSKGRNPDTGQNYRPNLELVRLAIPRRVYSDDHLKAVADGIARLYQMRDEISGLRMVYEPKKLRFFQSRFEPK